jgi:hypothetical protein
MIFDLTTITTTAALPMSLDAARSVGALSSTLASMTSRPTPHSRTARGCASRT